MIYTIKLYRHKLYDIDDVGLIKYNKITAALLQK